MVGWFTRDEPEYVWDAVVAGNVIYPAYTDDDGVAWLDTEDDIEIVIDGVVIGDEIWPAYADADGRVWVINDDDDDYDDD